MANVMQPKAVVKDIKIEDISIGDKLGQDVTGQDGKTLLMQGTIISAREMVFLRKQLAAKKPRYSAERYIVNEKSAGGIYAQDGECLVKPGQLVTAEAILPLVAEGFERIPGPEDSEVFYRRNEWPAGKPWHITDFNPTVRVETTTYVDDKGQELPDPRGSKVKVGGIKAGAEKLTGNAKTAKIAQAAGSAPARQTAGGKAA